MASLVVSYAGSWQLGNLKDGGGAVLAFFNACMLFCSALGMQETVVGIDVASKRVRGGTEEHGRRAVKWLSSWFRDD